MDKLERIYKLHRILGSRRTPISRTDLAKKLGCSRSTLTRLIRTSRLFIESPIEFDRERDGYYLDKVNNENFELPGLWFSSEEIHALMTSHRLLAEISPGILTPYINPLKERLEKLLLDSKAGNKAIFERVRILQMAPRIPKIEDFQKISSALVKREQLRIQYQSRGKDELSERWVSPQRLIYYRDNWYLDAWCHMRKALRTFSVDRVNVSENGEKAIAVKDEQLNEHFTRTYGIFSGPAKNKAVIRFSPEITRWVADEEWHPDQSYTQLNNGGCEITIPYGDPTELIMDILKYGNDAEVLSPPSLRKQIEEKLSKTLRKYRKLK